MALRVLLADESTTIKKVMQLALQDFAVEVKSVQSGVDVIEVAKTFQPDIIFVDVLLQKKNGYEVGADLKREAGLQEIPLVLMWSSFMDLDERLAQNSRADRRLEKPFDVENLRQIVLELVPKTRTQRLAHFLKFPENLNEGLRNDEAARGQSAGQPAPGAGAKAAPPPAAQAPTPPPPTRQSEKPPEKKSAPPLPVPVDRSPAPPEITAGFGDVTKPSFRLPPVTPAVDDDEESVDLSSAGIAVENSDERQSSSKKQGRPAASWNMESFEEIGEFGGSLDELPDDSPDDSQQDSPQLETEDVGLDVDDDEGFKEIRIAKKNPPPRASVEDADKTRVARRASPEDGDPWSHKDLARFKLDLPPIESEFGDDEQGRSHHRIELDLEGIGPAENSNFLHQRQSSSRSGSRPGSRGERHAELQDDPHDELADPPPLMELESYPDDGRSRAEFTASRVNTDNLAIEDDDATDEHGRDAKNRSSQRSSHEPQLRTRQNSQPEAMATDDLERIVRAQSREIIEALVRRIVPDLASDMIRQELDRLLAERDGAPR